MKNLIIFLCLLVFTCKVFSQNTYSLRGTVTEEMTKLPLPGATVKLVGSDNTSLEIKTDASGKYVFPDGAIKPNTTYVVSASGLDVKTKDFPDGVLGNPKAKISTNDLIQSTSFIQDFILKKIITTDYSPMVIFKKNKSELYDSIALMEIEYMSKLLINNPNITIEIKGHAGTIELNAKKLALQRAEVVKKRLLDFGINPQRLSVTSNVQADSIFLNNDLSYEEHFKQFYSIEQYRTRVYIVIIRKDFPDGKPKQMAPDIKVTKEDDKWGNK